MNPSKNYILIAMVSVLLGIILSMTFKTVNVSIGKGVLPSQRAQQIAAELKKEKEVNEELRATTDELEKKIREYENSVAQKDTYFKTLYDDAMKYRTLACYTDLRGEGLIIEITEPKSVLELGDSIAFAYNTDILLRLISALNASGAEAISINNQRFTSYTEVETAGGHIVINGVATNTPIVVKVIGNADYLYSALSIKNGIIDSLREYNYYVNVVKEKDLIVEKNRKSRVFKFAMPIEEK